MFLSLFSVALWIGPYEWMWWGVLILYGLTEILWFFGMDTVTLILNVILDKFKA